MRTTFPLVVILALLAAVAQGQSVPLDGHRFVLESGPITSLSFSPGGKTLALAGAQGKAVRLWSLPDGKPIDFPVKNAVAVAFSPDGKRIALASALSPRVTLLDASTGGVKAVVEGEGDRPMKALLFSPDGKRLLEVHEAEVRLRDGVTGKLVETFKEMPPVFAAAFSPDSTTLAVSFRDKVRLRDLARGRELGTIPSERHGTGGLAFSPDGTTLAVAGLGCVRLWDVARREQVDHLKGFAGMTAVVAFSPDGRTLAAGGNNSPVRLWDIATGEARADLPVLIRTEAQGGHHRVLHDVAAVAFSRDGRYLAAGTEGMARVWDIARTLAQPAYHVDNDLARATARGPAGATQVLAFSPDGRRFVAGSADGAITIHHTDTSKPALRWQGKGGSVNDLAFAPDSKSFAATVDNAIYRIDASTGKELKVYPSPTQQALSKVHFSPDGKSLLAVHDSRRLIAWDVVSGKETARHELARDWAVVIDMQWTPEGHLFVVHPWPARCWVIDVKTGKEVRSHRGPDGLHFRLAVRGGRVIVGEAENSRTGWDLMRWDIAAGREADCGDFRTRAVSMAATEDGKTLAAGFEDGVIRVWDLDARKERTGFRAHNGPVLAVSFAPDGKTLVSGTTDQAIKLWDMTKVLARAGTVTQTGSDPKKPPESPKLPEAERLALAGKAKQVLSTHCYRCHGQDGTAEGGFNFLLDRRRLIETKRVVPGDVKKSRLVQRVVREEMPPEDEKTRPSADEIAALKKWIDAGAPDWSTSAPRKLIALEEVARLLRADRARFGDAQRDNIRYLMVTHLYNAGWSEDELETVRQAASKLVNSLSTGPKVVPLTAVDPARTILRVDLRDYRLTHAHWALIEARNPYGLIWHEGEQRIAEPLPMRADWFVYAASRPPLYHLMLELPETLPELEQRLKVKSTDNIRDRKVLRAGFNGSGVSRNNRLIERHEGEHGYYWKSYDFAGNVGRQNLFDFPLGPAPGPRTFQHDGGEIIFRLPNGLQGYFLVDSRGNRIDRGPSNIVSDPKHPERVVENGISCMSCHARGLIDKSDQVRPHVEKNTEAFPERERETIMAVYPPRERFAEVLKADAESYRAAVAKTGARFSATEPIVVTALRFEAEVNLPQAAAEAWTTPEELLRRLDDFRSLSRALGALRSPGGTVQRQVFVRHVGTVMPRSRNVEHIGALKGDDTRDLLPAPPPRDVVVRDAVPFAAGSRRLTEYRRNMEGVCPPPIIDPTFRFIASMDDTATVKLFDAATDQVMHTLRGHRSEVRTMTFSRDGSTLATASTDGNVRLWNVKTGELRGEYPVPDVGFTPFALEFSPDGRKLAGTGPGKGQVLIWDGGSGKAIDSLKGNVSTVIGLAWSPDSAMLVTGDNRGLQPTAVVWDALTGKRRGELLGHEKSVFAVAVSPDGKTIVSTSGDGTIRLWDSEKLDQIAVDRLSTGEQRSSPVRWVTYSPDGKLLATAHGNGCVTLWDAENFRDLVVLQAHPENTLRNVIFSPDGKKLATSGHDGTLKFWDVPAMKRAAADRP